MRETLILAISGFGSRRRAFARRARSPWPPRTCAIPSIPTRAYRSSTSPLASAQIFRANRATWARSGATCVNALAEDFAQARNARVFRREIGCAFSANVASFVVDGFLGEVWMFLLFRSFRRGADQAYGSPANPLRNSPGRPSAIAASSDTLDFLRNAKTRRVEIAGAAVDGLLVAPDKAGQMVVAASMKAKTGVYAATISATSASGEVRQTAMTVEVKPRVTVPSNSTRNPVVLLNGWETGITNSCPGSEQRRGYVRQSGAVSGRGWRPSSLSIR